jgi:hypothetical protein
MFWWMAFIWLCRYRDGFICMSVRGPAAVILFFAPPKKSIQKKGGPDSACFLCFYENHPWFSPCGPAYRLFKFAPGKFVAFDEGFRRAIPGPAKTRGFLPLPCRAYFAKCCDARGGMTGRESYLLNWVQFSEGVKKACRNYQKNNHN